MRIDGLGAAMERLTQYQTKCVQGLYFSREVW